jgi:hypothetical protein
MGLPVLVPVIDSAARRMQVISKVAYATTKCSNRDETQEMLACLKAVVREGISHGVMLTTATHADLLRGYSAAADMKVLLRCQ